MTSVHSEVMAIHASAKPLFFILCVLITSQSSYPSCSDYQLRGPLSQYCHTYCSSPWTLQGCGLDGFDNKLLSKSGASVQNAA